jgi:hypothetical protein
MRFLGEQGLGEKLKLLWDGHLGRPSETGETPILQEAEHC